ncbi:GlxA family transcriptional regulator [Pantoea sp. PNT03]|jgi:transcriptional regulator GlxA family with amidase domain|uniref:GlxA family transcriptional regulator n=1 Tax=Pantoea sp. PNT03 TaxID=2769258 RepID=UPI0017853B8E|nr:GlxA family transcriptional regulator [Pantoea sp. PNT03]MBD9659759.1 GlxA family transcriptional regulator [Pantoea sp. PNT03]
MIKTDENSVVAEIGLVIYPDCQLAAIYGLTDMFRIAAEWAENISGEERKRTIRVSHWQIDAHSDHMVCVWDSHPDTAHRLSHVIAPPSLVVPAKMVPMKAPADWMSELYDAGVTLCSVCAGAFVLAETGLIDHRRATTHWAFAQTLSERFPAVDVAVENMVIDDGDIITAGGILAWTDLGLTLIEKVLGTGTMLATSRFLLIDPPRREQSTYSAFIPNFDHGDSQILRAQHHLHAHVAEQHSIESMSALASMTPRTFLRHFQKATGLRPTDYLQQVRIMKARDALELSNRSVDQIAWEIGYSDPSAFRKIFRKLTGVTPGQYRQRFGTRQHN